MPWKTDGTFERITNNTQESGISLWQQDLSASVKIIAYRHDYHDHDLAEGIANTLSLDGYNSMRADLDMNGQKVINLAPATGLEDIPTYGQLAETLTWDAGLGLLTLRDRNGDELSNVTIVTGGTGGGGTVSSITAGDGLSSTQNPLVTAGTMSLETLGVAQSFSGGIASINIDKHGRVTQVTEGAYANTNLDNIPASDSVKVTSSTGIPTTLPAATDSSAGVMTAEQVQQLNAASGGEMKAPIELVGTSDGLSNIWSLSDGERYDGTVASGDGWKPIFSYNGSGMIDLLAMIVREDVPAGVLLSARIVIDGIVVWQVNDLWDDTRTIYDGTGPIGNQTSSGDVYGRIYFNESISAEFFSSSATVVDVNVTAKWNKYS